VLQRASASADMRASANVLTIARSRSGLPSPQAGEPQARLSSARACRPRIGPNPYTTSQDATTELTDLPWVGHGVRKWEPEPLRWVGVHERYAAYRVADRREAATRSTES
jgi:hypothetical protein